MCGGLKKVKAHYGVTLMAWIFELNMYFKWTMSTHGCMKKERLLPQP